LQAKDYLSQVAVPESLQSTITNLLSEEKDIRLLKYESPLGNGVNTDTEVSGDGIQ
jgi:hypothetical protein